MSWLGLVCAVRVVPGVPRTEMRGVGYFIACMVLVLIAHVLASHIGLGEGMHRDGRQLVSVHEFN
jgi:hypothetical protein